jgi:hypothetical protein
LQHIVGQVADIADIAEEVVDTVFDKLRRDPLIPLGQWLEGVGINGVVEREDRAVDTFPWIIFRRRVCGERGQQDSGTHRQLSEVVAPAHSFCSLNGLSWALCPE